MSQRRKSAGASRLGPPLTDMKLSEWIPVLFLVFVFLLGGGARSDIASLPVLRGVAVFFAFWAALRLRGEDWRRIRVPLTLLLLLALWMVLQLFPLPAGIWHGLPGRDTIVAIDRLTGQAELWRPLSLMPSQTLNALLAMTVPIAALLVAAQMAPEEYPRLMTVMILIACASALLGLVQILSGPASPAYLYRIANRDSMIGLFSNRNHHAIFLACVIPLVAMTLRDELMRKRKRTLVRTGLALAGIMLTLMTILIGSRGGLVAGVLSFVISYAIVAGSWSMAEPASGHKETGPSRYRRWFLYAPPALLVLFVSATLFLSSRTTALTRFMDQSVGDDLRVSAWPTVQSMIETYWLAGSGFGSFPGVYKMFEPDRLLQGAYFNHAHNDWAEAILTGGLPFALIVAAAFVWLGKAIVARGARNLIKGHRGDVRLPILIVILLLAATSLADYPLRVPSIQVLAMILILFVCCPRPSRPRRDGLQ